MVSVAMTDLRVRGDRSACAAIRYALPGSLVGVDWGGGVVVTGASRRLGFPSPVRESEEENVPYGEMEFVICEADSLCFFFLYFFFFILHTS